MGTNEVEMSSRPPSSFEAAAIAARRRLQMRGFREHVCFRTVWTDQDFCAAGNKYGSAMREPLAQPEPVFVNERP